MDSNEELKAYPVRSVLDKPQREKKKLKTQEEVE